MGSVLLSGQGEAAAATVVVAAASLTGLTRTAQGVGLRTHQGVDESCQQLAQHIGVAGGESISQHSWPVNIVGSWSSRRILCSSDFGRSREESSRSLR
jgi:hypothetical protein